MLIGRLQSYMNSTGINSQLGWLFRNPLVALLANAIFPPAANPATPDPGDNGEATPPDTPPDTPDPGDNGEATPPDTAPDTPDPGVDEGAAARTLLYSHADASGEYALHGDFIDDSFVFGISSTAAPISTNTTIWLNTDLDTTTGHQIWDWAGGAEYNININADGKAQLFTGAAGETFVADLDYAYNANRSVIEIAVSQVLIDSALPAVQVLADVNDSVFLPNDYGNITLQVGELPPPVVNPDASDALRVAILYSETTADNFYDVTAYGQLFMSAQNQAMQAGIPYDLLTEADLLDPANLAAYDAIIFPAFSHAQAAEVETITASLMTAMQDYGVGLIAAGNFLTNDESGAALPGDS